jgi:hypothetical protein
MSDQTTFNPPTIIQIQIPDVQSDTATYITAEEARIVAARTQNSSTLTALQTLLAQVQVQIDTATAVNTKLDADEAGLTVLRGTLPAPVVTPPVDVPPVVTPPDTGIAG